MISFPEVQEYRMLSLAWVDKENSPRKVLICAVESFEAERTFMKEFDNKGWLYKKVLEDANVNATEVSHLRLVSETLPVVLYGT